MKPLPFVSFCKLLAWQKLKHTVLSWKSSSHLGNSTMELVCYRSRRGVSFPEAKYYLDLQQNDDKMLRIDAEPAEIRWESMCDTLLFNEVDVKFQVYRWSKFRCHEFYADHDITFPRLCWTCTFDSCIPMSSIEAMNLMDGPPTRSRNKQICFKHNVYCLLQYVVFIACKL